METLNYKVLEGTGYNGYILKDAPVKVMQFGEGNFLRAFVDYFYDIANEKAGYNGKVKLVQPIGNFPQMADWINEQEGLYTLYLRGSEKGQKVDAKRVISCVSDCVCPYIDGKWDEVLALARSEDLETVVSNTSTNPMATIFAWSGALKKRGELDSLPALVRFGEALEAASLQTLNDGIMTKDLCGLAEGITPTQVNSEEFIQAIRTRLEAKLA